MTILYINTGSSPNKGDGDTLRTAFTKINANFGFLSTSSGGVNTIIAGSGIHISTSTGNVIISATGSGSGNGNIIQSATAPIPATTTTLWYDTVGGRTYTYFEGSWVDTNPQVSSYSLPAASTSTLGGVKVDGVTVTINSSTGVISSVGNATTSTLNNGSHYFALTPTGSLTNGSYQFPSTHGTLGQVLVDNGYGVLEWSDTSSLVNGSHTLNLGTDGSVNLPTNDGGNSLLQSANPVEIESANLSWIFDQSGNLTLPTPPQTGPHIQAFGTGMILEVTGTAGSWNFSTGTTTTNYVTMSPGVTFGTGAFTIEGWAYFDNFLTNQPILGTTTSSGGLSLIFESNNTVAINSAGGNTTNFTVGPATANAWHHFAVVRDGSGSEMVWLDGVASTSGVQTDSSNYSGVTSFIGKTYNSNFFGQVSALKIVNNAIHSTSASTIAVPALFPVENIYQDTGTVLSLPMINPQLAFVDRTNFPNPPVQTLTVQNQVTFEVNGNPNIALGTQGPVQTFTFHKYGSIRWPDLTEQFTAFTGTIAWSNITDIPELSAISTATISNGIYSVTIGTNGVLNLPANTSSIIASAGPITIDSLGEEFVFGTDGSLTFPDGTVQPTAFNPYRHTTFYGQVTFNSTVTNNYAANATTTTNILELHQPTGGLWTFDDTKDIGIQFDYYNNTVNSNATATILLAHDTQWFEFYSNGGFDGSQSQFYGTQYATIKAGALVLANSTATITFADSSLQTTAWTGTVASLTNDGQSVTLHVGGRTTLPGDSTGTNFFNFNVAGDGAIHFPDSTVQPTAWTGSTSTLVNGTYTLALSTSGGIVLPGNNSGYDNIALTYGNPLRVNPALSLNAPGGVNIGSYNSSFQVSTSTINWGLYVNAGEAIVSYDVMSNTDGTAAFYPGTSYSSMPNTVGVDLGITTSTISTATNFGTWRNLNLNGNIRFGDGTQQTTAFTTASYISKATLKSVVAASTNFTDFQARIAAL
jgi:hypothetical protein